MSVEPRRYEVVSVSLPSDLVKRANALLPKTRRSRVIANVLASMNRPGRGEARPHGPAAGVPENTPPRLSLAPRDRGRRAVLALIRPPAARRRPEGVPADRRPSALADGASVIRLHDLQHLQ